MMNGTHRRVTGGILILMTAITLLVAGCSRSEPEQVVLYVSADEYVARDIVRRFEDETGIEVVMLGDTEAKKTTGLVERLRRESDNPQADVFWSSECFLTIALADEGVLDEHVSEATADWPLVHRDGQRRWFGFSARARVVVFDPAQLGDESPPATWMDLTDARWKGRIVMADPRFGTTGGHLAAMRTYWRRLGLGDAYYDAFVEGLAANEVQLIPTGNAGVVEAVARGEAAIGLTDTDDVWAARNNGYGVELVYPRHHRETEKAGGGTLLIPNTVARVKGGPNPESAAVLIDYLLSAATERALAASVSHNIPLRPELAGAYPAYVVDDPLDVNLVQAAALRTSTIERTMRELHAEAEGEDG